ncbi:unnamed protein product [Xylocopa violacea]|uniref:Uncharacterized protein n=1 Tax=Xylocopa violacea TaxID=135666 RepID=A0ABP1ND60_XYLVO
MARPWGPRPHAEGNAPFSAADNSYGLKPKTTGPKARRVQRDDHFSARRLDPRLTSLAACARAASCQFPVAGDFRAHTLSLSLRGTITGRCERVSSRQLLAFSRYLSITRCLGRRSHRLRVIVAEKVSRAGLQFRSTYPRPSIFHIYARRSVQDSGSPGRGLSRAKRNLHGSLRARDARGIHE